MYKLASILGIILVGGSFIVHAEIPTGVTFETFYDIDKIDFDQPTFVGAVPSDPDQLIVMERSGKAFRLIKTAGVYEKKAWFSLDADTTTHWDGAWVVEFHPKFAQNHLFYVLYRQKINGRRSVIEEWKTDAIGLANPIKVRSIIEFNQVSIHSSGDVKFGPDGFLYSSQGDRNQYEKGGPLMSEMWGKVIRIDVDKKDSGLEYAIPLDNPFRTQAGARPEIFALGFRMPWRMSFDKVTKDLWLGDVGDLLHEEVNVVQIGKNYGAGVVEGKCTTAKCATMVDPVLEQPRADGSCIIGGFVYRADPASKFYGVYLFGDFISKKIYGARLNDQKTGLSEMASVAGAMPGTVSAMGQDGSGNFYAAMYKESGSPRTTHIYRLKHPELKAVSVSLLPKQAREDNRAEYQIFGLDGRTFSYRILPKGDPRHNNVFIIKNRKTGAIQKGID
jgi:hypothetical protein